MLKILHLIPRDAIGGVESAARSMLNAPELNCDFDVVFIEGERKSGTGGKMPIFSIHPENSPIAHMRALRTIISSKPNLLICSLWRSVPVSLCFKLLRPRSKLVFFLHSSITTHLLDRLFSRWILVFCDAVWADSAATISSRVGSNEGLIKRVISFVTNNSPENIARNELAPHFVFWGRLHHHKGLDRAINFIRMLNEKGYPASYEIWGPDGGEYRALTTQVEKSKLMHAVKFKGTARQNQLTEIASGNCFYLQLSREEGMAMSVVEAMQLSLVPVVSPVGEIGTYCKHHHNAIVVEDSDNPIDAVNDVIALLQNEAKYRGLQAKSYEHWADHVLYKDDICLAANELYNSN
jgi:glycosyltransferase involved in cell wall biosynthesis